MLLSNLALIEEYQHLSRNQESQRLLENPLLQKDVWQTISDLSLGVNEHQRYLSLNFGEISQEWFKLLAKLFVLKKVKKGLKIATLVSNLRCFRTFSKFLNEHSVYNPEQIDDHVFETFDYYLKLLEVEPRNFYVALSNFFDVCRLEGWLDVNTLWFQGRKKIKPPNNDEINYLPEEVWNQLNDNLHYLPEPLQRMVLVIRTLGLRLGEVCSMPFDCLRKRGEQWHVRLTSEKYDIEDELPIIPELVAVIQEQQEYIRQNLGENYNYLFCANNSNKHKEVTFEPCPRVIAGKSFNRWLNWLARKHGIRSNDGEIWHFQSHQFRRTVATVMENAGIRDLIIQKYLRHRSPDMQRYYTHLLKTVLGDEFEELMREKKYVDITGKIAAIHRPINPVTELLRRRMYQITTQYGQCHRSSLKSPCPTVNACWRCKVWRTSVEDLPYLREDLKRVEEELQIATELGMVRQHRGLEGDREVLLNRIRGLEAIQ